MMRSSIKLTLVIALSFTLAWISHPHAQTTISGGGGGGGTGGSVNIADPTTPANKAAVNGAGQLSITCANCSGSGASFVDKAAFTVGTSSGAPAMGLFQTALDTISSGTVGVFAMDSKRSQFMVIRDAALNARGVNVTVGNALTVDGSASTQPISGTVTANIGTSGSLALDASVTGLQVSQGSTTSGQKGGLTLGAVTTSAPSYTTAQSSPLSLDTSGNLRINCITGCGGGTGGTALADNAAFTQGTTSETPISGLVTPGGGYAAGTAGHSTIWQMTSAGEGFINLSKVAGTALATGNGVTGAGSPRITIASDNTAFAVNANQAGSWTVTANAGTNLNTSALALDTSVNGLLLAQASTTSGQKGPLLQAAVTTSPPTYTTAQTSPLSLDVAGNLRTSVLNTVSVAGTLSNNNAAPGGNNVGALIGLVGTNVPTYTNGNLAALSLTTSGEGRMVIDNGSAVTTEAATYSPGGANIAETIAFLNAYDGTNLRRVIGKTSAPASSDFGLTVRPLVATDGTNNTPTMDAAARAGFMVPTAATTGGCTPFHYLAAASSNQDAQSPKGSAGQLYTAVVYQNASTKEYVKLYDKASGPTSADTPVQTYVVGATTGAGTALPIPVGMNFANGISFRLTTGLADNDAGAVTANDLVVDLCYK